jgi:hypothetical protein
MTIDQDRLMEFVHRFVGDLGATMAAGNVIVGDRLGLYRALAEEPPAAGTYSLTEEQAFALTDPDGPIYLPCAFQLGGVGAAGRVPDRGGVPDRRQRRLA